MHDIRLIRNDPAAFDADMARRGLAPQAAALLALDAQHRAQLTELQALQSRRNQVSQSIGQLLKNGQHAEAEAAKAEVSALKTRMTGIEAAARTAQGALSEALALLPNRPAPEVPFGEDETANQEIRRWGTPRQAPDHPSKPHFELGEAWGLMDFESAGRISGARFVVLKGALARLERALANFMLDLHGREHGLEETLPPALVRGQALYGTSQLPKFAEDLFKIDGEDRYLIPTSEVPLTNLVAEQIVAADSLPYRYTALTPCFRSEAGSAGRDTRGLIRLHQFSKVEMVSITRAEESEAELERMTACAEAVLKALELPYRVMLLSTQDMGFGALKTYDLEVWLPGQSAYREISSCSNCGDFQARRMNARYRTEDETQTRFLHTLNGSGLAVGRTLVAVLENYQQADGSVAIPPVLHPYMGGITRIG